MMSMGRCIMLIIYNRFNDIVLVSKRMLTVTGVRL